MSDGWRQFNLRLANHPDAYRRLADASLLDRLDTWATDGALEHAFFMHKSPGIRLRIRPRVPGITSAVWAEVENLRSAGAIDHMTLDYYEPEHHLFGGQSGLRFAHAYFTADSLAIWSYFRAAARIERPLPALTVSTALVSRLLTNLLDGWELWDIWMRLAQVRGPAEAAIEPAVFHQIDEGLTLGQLEAVAVRGAGLDPWHDRYADRVVALTGEIANARNIQGLDFGLRDVLPFWIAFHWNRMGFDLASQRATAGYMARLTDPRPWLARDMAAS